MEALAEGLRVGFAMSGKDLLARETRKACRELLTQSAQYRLT